MENKEWKYAIEALLFASDRPLLISEIEGVFSSELTGKEIEGFLAELRSEYDAEARGFRLFEIAGGCQLVTDNKFAPFLKKFFQDREKRRLSRASLETLSVIAYRQPVTRADIEFIRGVNVDGSIASLTEKKLIRVVGKKDAPGRPLLYGTTREFLERFGLSALKDLPPLSEFTEKDIAAEIGKFTPVTTETEIIREDEEGAQNESR